MLRHTNVLCLTAAVCLLFGSLAAAADKGDPNGTWKWVFKSPDGQEVPLSMELKLDGEKLTGKVIHDEQSLDISEGTFADNDVAFTVMHEQDGNKIMAKFKGKLEADAINGKVDIEVNGQSLSVDWNATREKK